jgi:hypothetical protein
MRRRAAASSPDRGRRLLALIAGLVLIGGTVAITQFASAEDNETQACAEQANATTLRDGDGRRGDRDRRRRPRPEQPAPTNSAPPAEESPAPEDPPAPENPPSEPPAEPSAPGEEPGSPAPEEPSTPPEDCDEGEGGGQSPPPPPNNGLDILGNNCDPSNLEAHTGFQQAPRCVSTAFGEVSSAANNPSLLITQAPRRVTVNTPFTLQVSTRNLIRDRFLGAAAGGYYLESAYLTADGLTRGHFHAACRMLDSTQVAPDPAPVPAFFRAIEDGGGGNQPDQVTVEVTGMPATGTASCAVWAGDGSHRIPMMERANQTPAFDVVRIRVTN